jgi:hypothetical protein
MNRGETTRSARSQIPQGGRLDVSDAGFSLLELTIAAALVVVLTGAIFQLLDPASADFQAQPEVADMQQRLRTAAIVMQRALLQAGAVVDRAASAGAVNGVMAPILPHRIGATAADPPGTFRGHAHCPSDCASVLTVVHTPAAFPGATLTSDLEMSVAQGTVAPRAGCPEGDVTCGLEAGMQVLVFTAAGVSDVFTITEVQGATLTLKSLGGEPQAAYPAGSSVARIESQTYYLREDAVAQTYELRRYDGDESDLPVIDHLVDFRIELFGDPMPPQLIRPASAETGPWTTYGPMPPPLGTDEPGDPHGAGENCVFHVDPETGQQTARPELQTFGTSLDPPMPLTRAMLTDGPWCPAAVNAGGEPLRNRFDADLLRVRRVRVTIRVQVASALLRGPAGPLFRVAGRSRGGRRFVPDQELRVDVAPPNLNLGR